MNQASLVSLAVARTPPSERERVTRAVEQAIGRLVSKQAQLQDRIVNLDRALANMPELGRGKLARKRAQLVRERDTVRETLRELREYASGEQA